MIRAIACNVSNHGILLKITAFISATVISRLWNNVDLTAFLFIKPLPDISISLLVLGYSLKTGDVVLWNALSAQSLRVDNGESQNSFTRKGITRWAYSMRNRRWKPQLQLFSKCVTKGERPFVITAVAKHVHGFRSAPFSTFSTRSLAIGWMIAKWVFVVGEIGECWFRTDFAAVRHFSK